MKELIKLDSFDYTNNELEIEEKFIRFNGKEIKLEDITGIKVWVNSIEFYKFSIGRKYEINLKSGNEQLNLNFKSFFGISNKYFSQLYERILDRIWEIAIERIWARETEELLRGKTLRFGHCYISRKGIFISNESLLNKKERLIDWENLHYEKNFDKLVLNCRSDKTIYTNLYYKDNWNMEVLIALLDWLTKENGFAEIKK